ncbi:glycosyltransferase family 2 protein [Chryseobacterium sp. cx-311]|nr:glycosyltransferase family 2 protein [Marnyiella aurantia]
MYNVKQHLSACIASVTEQRLPFPFEIIMVDDGSPDDSLEVAQILAKQDPRIRVISQENKGLGGARNTGITHAVGKYILFLDADDRLVLQDFSFLEKAEGSQIIQLASENINPDGGFVSHYSPPTVWHLKGRDFWLLYPVMPSACNKIYLRKFLIDNSLFFKEHLLSEDIEFNTRAFFHAQAVSSYNLIIQQFVQTPNSITRSGNLQSRKKLYSDLCKIATMLIQYRNKNADGKTDFLYFNKIVSDLGMGLLNMGIKIGIETSDINQMKQYLIEKGIPLYSQKYDNVGKNIFKRILQLPYSIEMLKIVLHR